MKLFKKYIKNIYFAFKQKKYLKQKNSPLEKNTIKQIKSKKAQVALKLQEYSYKPKLSFILTSYNHKSNINENFQILKKYEYEQLIVCEDGSLDGSYEEWNKLLKHPNDYLIKTNEINELFIYDKGIRLTNSDFVCLHQDDDILPTNKEWIKNALKLFDHFPDLAIIGCNEGYIFDDNEKKIGPYNKYICSDHPEPRNNGQFNLPIKNKLIDEKFIFVHAVNNGPFFIRRSFYENIGGYDLEKIGVGNNGIHFDWDLCLEAQKKGLKVALLNTLGVKRRVNGASSLIFSNENRYERYKINLEHLNQKYNSSFLIESSKKILKDNSQIV